MQNASSDRIAKLTAELKEVQAMLSERQRELLRAISGNGPGQDVLRRQVRALGYCAMGIIAEIEQELQRRRGIAPERVPPKEADTDGEPLAVAGQGQGAPRAPRFSLRGHFAG
jgi:hypothetical protein